MQADLQARRLDAAKRTKGTSSSTIYRLVLDTAARMIDKGCHLLEFGAGTGSLVRMLRAAGFAHITAADILPRPNDLDGVSWIQRDLNEPLPAPDGAYDAVVSTEVIEHLENPRAVFRELGRVLRPGGHLLLTTPNQESVRSLLSLVVRGHYVDFLDSSYPAHISAVLRMDLSRMCAEGGFEPPRFFYTDVGSLPAAPHMTWQQVSAGLLRGRRFSDTLAMTSRKRR
ncbi:MAG: methyltransferase domain-containing protein [Acidobacteria bacterium]|nr:MAG: methyltransferase domain-containing protein [Acidobacteriota bacterium]